MKKLLITLFTILLCISVSASDITARLANGKTVILHDDMTWEYYKDSTCSHVGRWILDEGIFDQFFVAQGIYPGTYEYELSKALISSMYSGILDMQIIIYDNGRCYISALGEEHFGDYYLDASTRLMTLEVDGDTGDPGLFFFTEDYSRLYMVNLYDSSSMEVYFTKDSSFVASYPEQQKVSYEVPSTLNAQQLSEELLNELERDEDASVDVVKALIAAGADVTSGESWGYNPLCYAMSYCNEDVKLVLISAATEKQVNTMSGYDSDETPLTCELNNDEDASVYVVKALIAAGADVTLGESWGYNPLCYAMSYCNDDVKLVLISAATEKQINTVEEGITPLLVELYNDEDASVDVVKALIAAGADVTLGGFWEYNPLLYAFDMCNDDVKLALISAATKEQINTAVEGITPLLIELGQDEYASVDVVKALIAAGADVTLGELWGFGPIKYAARYCSDEILRLLIDIWL